MAGLNHGALWKLAAEEAKEEAACMWPHNKQDERKQTEYCLTVRYYKEYVTPPSRYGDS